MNSIYAEYLDIDFDEKLSEREQVTLYFSDPNHQYFLPKDIEYLINNHYGHMTLENHIGHLLQDMELLEKQRSI
jgi:hypothetical protein